MSNNPLLVKDVLQGVINGQLQPLGRSLCDDHFGPVLRFKIFDRYCVVSHFIGLRAQDEHWYLQTSDKFVISEQEYNIFDQFYTIWAEFNKKNSQ